MSLEKTESPPTAQLMTTEIKFIQLFLVLAYPKTQGMIKSQKDLKYSVNFPMIYRVKLQESLLCRRPCYCTML